jgi:hypothetical protein
MSAGFAKAIAKRLLGKMVEIYTSDEHDTLNYAESNRHRNSVIHGKLVEVDGECIILEVTIRDKTNIMYVNSWSVQSICEPKNGLSVWDMYVCVERKMVK